ncbi:hypothetical protein PMAYCL1PPCAC_09950 [Pristionchus mayeri]|uniref:TAZ-type domain-containing protein n=1 Tax=Pristionchus mayeri TaxID=1317129 RepID=A0AAN5CCK9_9BILA|nr:hypothetical protein PMAYCL1PPCAC_09950 [Pristionchus mayeri]
MNPYYIKTRKRKLLGADNNNDARSFKMECLDETFARKRRASTVEEEEITPGDQFVFSRNRMKWIHHSNACRWDYCSKKCYWTKSLIAHVKECPNWDCKRTGCIPTKELLMHHNNCRPVEENCRECGNEPEEGLYRGKDYFADHSGDVLRRICGFLDNKSLDALQAVNIRVYNLFQYPREIRELYTKTEFEELRIEKLADGSTIFRFLDFLTKGSGYAHIFVKSGEQKRFHYTEKYEEEARQYIISNFGILDHVISSPIQLSPEFYGGLELALEKFEFKKLYFGSITIDEQFENIYHRSEQLYRF